MAFETVLITESTAYITLIIDKRGWRPIRLPWVSASWYRQRSKGPREPTSTPFLSPAAQEVVTRTEDTTGMTCPLVTLQRDLTTRVRRLRRNESVAYDPAEISQQRENRRIGGELTRVQGHRHVTTRKRKRLPPSRSAENVVSWRWGPPRWRLTTYFTRRRAQVQWGTRSDTSPRFEAVRLCPDVPLSGPVEKSIRSPSASSAVPRKPMFV